MAGSSPSSGNLASSLQCKHNLLMKFSDPFSLETDKIKCADITSRTQTISSWVDRHTNIFSQLEDVESALIRYLLND
jgi:hypothetical protein